MADKSCMSPAEDKKEDKKMMTKMIATKMKGGRGKKR